MKAGCIAPQHSLDSMQFADLQPHVVVLTCEISGAHQGIATDMPVNIEHIKSHENVKFLSVLVAQASRKTRMFTFIWTSLVLK